MHREGAPDILHRYPFESLTEQLALHATGKALTQQAKINCQELKILSGNPKTYMGLRNNEVPINQALS